MKDALTLARHLRTLRWGEVEGPRNYAELPASLQKVAREVDSIGDKLASFRVHIFRDDIPAGDRIVQVQMLAHVAASCALAKDFPDKSRAWLRRELEGELFSEAEIEAALHFWASGGQPNVFRDEDLVGWPSFADIQAFQKVCANLADLCEGVEEEGFSLEGTSMLQCLEDFAMEHGAHGEFCGELEGGWELHPAGGACFEAVKATKHLPVEMAESPEDPEPPEASADSTKPHWLR